MTIPVCAVTGRIAGDHDACGDCDPCGAAHAVPDVVKRLLAEKEEWRQRYGETATTIDDMRASLEWVLPIAEQGLENARQERLRCGHSFGSKRVGLHDFEVAAMERAHASLTTGQGAK